MKGIKFHPIFLTLIMLILLILVPSVKSISNANTIQGTISGIFVDPQPTCPPATCTGIGTSAITWGIPGDSPEGHVSSFDFSGRSFIAEEGQPFVAGEFTYYNGTTKTGTTIESVKFCTEATITNPEPQIITGCRDIYIITTPNTSSDPEDNADLVTMQIGPHFATWESDSATATIIVKIKNATVTPASARSEAELELEILGFGEVISGNGFLRYYVHLPIVTR